MHRHDHALKCDACPPVFALSEGDPSGLSVLLGEVRPCLVATESADFFYQ